MLYFIIFFSYFVQNNVLISNCSEYSLNKLGKTVRKYLPFDILYQKEG